MKDTKRIEQLFGIIALLILCIAAFLVVRPFLSALLLSVILVISTWPLFDALVRILRGRKTLAALTITVAFTVALLLPLAFLLTSLGAQVNGLTDTVKNWIEIGLPPAPAWVHDLPFVGERLAGAWAKLSFGGTEVLLKIKPYVPSIAGWILRVGTTFGGAVVEITIALIVSFFFFRDGMEIARKIEAVLSHLAGTNAGRLIQTASLTLKSVVYGILGTALVQALLAWIGFVVAGVPAAALLGFITFFLSLVPIGPPLLWIPAGLWLISTGSTAWAVFLFIWGVLVISGADNIVKPYLISKGSNLPLILIFLGVIGGAMQFGFIGVFLGPTLLAVVFALLREWMEQPKAIEVGDPAKKVFL